MTNISSLTTFTSTEKFLGITASTIKKFSDYIELVYLSFFVKRFSFKAKEQEKSPRKIYAIDTGIANVGGFRFTENIGKIAENAVYLELKKRQAVNPEIELYYWKDERHKEVDFVIKEGLKVTGLIQTCWDSSGPKTKQREIISLVKAAAEFNLKKALVINEEFDAVEKHSGVEIEFVPLWKWLISA